jgi:hypothetical protein
MNHRIALPLLFVRHEQNCGVRLGGFSRGNKLQSATFDSHTIIEAGIFEKNKTIEKRGNFLAYITNGEAIVNGIKVTDGDLIDDHDLTLLVLSEHLHLTLISHR